MREPIDAASAASGCRKRIAGESGFSIVEFVIASGILLVMAGAVFTMIARTQRSSSYQTEVQTVLENTRIAMDTLTHYVRQAGNDPRLTGLQGVTVTSGTRAQFVADVTGSAGGDRGDPDGDTADAGENVVIQYNSGAQSIELVQGGTTQTIANNISGFGMQYFDAAGAATSVGANVRLVRLTITGQSTLADPQTRQSFGITLTSDVQIASRQ